MSKGLYCDSYTEVDLVRDASSTHQAKCLWTACSNLPEADIVKPVSKNFFHFSKKQKNQSEFPPTGFLE